MGKTCSHDGIFSRTFCQCSLKLVTASALTSRRRNASDVQEHNGISHRNSIYPKFFVLGIYTYVYVLYICSYIYVYGSEYIYITYRFSQTNTHAHAHTLTCTYTSICIYYIIVYIYKYYMYMYMYTCNIHMVTDRIIGKKRLT